MYPPSDVEPLSFTRHTQATTVNPSLFAFNDPIQRVSCHRGDDVPQDIAPTEDAEEQHKRLLNRMAQQRCRYALCRSSMPQPISFSRRARRKQKLTEMEKLIDSLQRELQSFEATKAETEGLLLENAMLRRLSSQQTACIAVLRKQLAEMLFRESAAMPSPVLKKRSYETYHLYPRVDQVSFLNESALLCHPYGLPRIPLPVPQFEAHSTSATIIESRIVQPMTETAPRIRNPSKDFGAVRYDVRGGEAEMQTEAFSDLLSDTSHLDDGTLFGDVRF